MAFIMIPEELLEVDITAAQLRALIHIINNTYSSGKYAGCCCLGYQNLADLCFTRKGAAINTLKQLEQLGFIEINRRERFNRSNAIKLTLENGYERYRSKSGDCSGDDCERSLNRTDERSLNRTLQGSLNRTLGSLNRTEGSLNRTLHIDLKFKNQDLKTKTRAYAGEDRSLKGPLGGADGLNNVREDEPMKIGNVGNQIAPADGAAGRSKLIEESARDVMAASSAAKDADRILLQDIRAKFTDIFADLSLSKTGNTYILRKKGKYALIEDVRLREVVYWLCARGLDARIMDTQTRVLGEVLLEEVA